uniref:Uncharacterized protein n=1 Tax=Setaria viridis TaxID=4556 RepID=A0A4U6SRZ7_SETVI|nr:hypothetical protein SEVIR_9G065800v2 [Setaria viridis]
MSPPIITPSPSDKAQGLLSIVLLDQSLFLLSCRLTAVGHLGTQTVARSGKGRHQEGLDGKGRNMYPATIWLRDRTLRRRLRIGPEERNLKGDVARL